MKGNKNDEYLPADAYQGHTISKDGFARFLHKDGLYYFAYFEVGQLLFRSEGYRSEKAMEKGVSSVKKNMDKVERYKVLKLKPMHWILSLRAGNHREIAVTPIRDSKDAALLLLPETRTLALLTALNQSKEKKERATIKKYAGENDYLAKEDYEGHHRMATQPDFVIFSQEGLQYFALLDRHGGVLLRSEGYTTIGARNKGIKAVLKSMGKPKRRKIIEKFGMYFLILRSGNHREIARSCALPDKAAALTLLAPECLATFGGILPAAAETNDILDKEGLLELGLVEEGRISGEELHEEMELAEGEAPPPEWTWLVPPLVPGEMAVETSGESDLEWGMPLVPPPIHIQKISLAAATPAKELPGMIVPAVAAVVTGSLDEGKEISVSEEREEAHGGRVYMATLLVPPLVEWRVARRPALAPPPISGQGGEVLPMPLPPIVPVAGAPSKKALDTDAPKKVGHDANTSGDEAKLDHGLDGLGFSSCIKRLLWLFLLVALVTLVVLGLDGCPAGREDFSAEATETASDAPNGMRSDVKDALDGAESSAGDDAGGEAGNLIGAAPELGYNVDGMDAAAGDAGKDEAPPAEKPGDVAWEGGKGMESDMDNEGGEYVEMTRGAIAKAVSGLGGDATRDQIISALGELELESLYFGLNNWELRPAGKHQLDKLIAVMKANPHVKVKFMGNADTRGDWKVNARLSRKRAQSALTYAADWGVSRGRLSWEMFSDSRPKAKNDVGDEERLQLNRRVDLLLEIYGKELINTGDKVKLD